MIPNLLSLSRVFLIFGLFAENPLVRAAVIIFAALSDFLDGFLARKLGQTSRLGTLLDPITDKLFVAAALGLFFYEEKLTALEILLFSLRDISLILFTAYLWITKSLQSWQIRSFFCGKLMTTCQFVALLFLALNSPIPGLLFGALALFGTGSIFELLIRSTYASRSSN
jgi:CDP-diacylglycerol---glycerol-3-phosphate 3-phosphatidyltransferase